MNQDKVTMNSLGAPEALLDFLVECDLMSSGSAKTTISRLDIVKEAVDDDEDIVLSESSTETYVDVRGVRVAWSLYWDVYRNVERYPDPDDVMKALGYDTFSFSNKTNVTDTLRNIGKAFSQKHGKPSLGKPSNRRTGWAANGFIRQQFEENDIDKDVDDIPDDFDIEPPSRADVNPGSRTRKNRLTRLADDLNSKDLLPGTLYSQYTKIPKANWAPWWKFWNKERRSVAPERDMIGKEWKKYFIFGYEVEEDLFYEVWYNTRDSAFSLHDKRGIELVRRAPTMTEIIRKMFLHIVQAASTDVDFDRARFNNNVRMSLTRSMARELPKDERMKEMLKTEEANRKKAAIEKIRAAREKKEKGGIKGAASRAAGKTAYGVGAASAVAASVAKDAAGMTKAAYDNVKGTGTVFKDFDMGANGEQDYKRAAPSAQTVDGNDPDIEAVTGEYLPAPRKRKNNNTPQPARGETAIELPAPEDQEAKRREEERKERTKAYKDALKQYQKARKDSDSVVKYMQDNPPAAEKQTDEKPVKPDTRQSKAPDVGFPKKKERLGSIFGDNPYDNAGDDDSGLRRKQTKAERDELKSLFADDDSFDDDYDAFIDQMTGVTESYEVLTEDAKSDIADIIATDLRGEVSDSDYERTVQEVRRGAERSRYTTTGLINAIGEETITPYNKTRAESGGKLRWLEKRFLKGRPDIRILPTDKRGIFNRTKNFLIGGAFRADFIIGFSLSDRVNYEIWYVTEPNPAYNWFKYEPSEKKFISSFYVYDISSERLVRKYIPYYRNAAQTVFQKIGAL